MKICIAQTAASPGNIRANVKKHIHFINKAAEFNANLIIFPELSLTGYEPKMANTLALDRTEKVFGEFQKTSDRFNMSIAIGAPFRSSTGILIGLIIFHPGGKSDFYSKNYLHSDEEPYFVTGNENPVVNIGDTATGFAICYEINREEHLERIMAAKPDIYIASVAKSHSGVKDARARLAEISGISGLDVLLCNNTGPNEDFTGGGKSAVWKNGNMLTELNETQEGIIIFDTTSGECLTLQL